MTLDEAIKYAQDVADTNCDQCAEDHRQLAGWLKELKELREQGWRPASELPKESGVYVVITDFYSCQTATFAKYDKDRGWDTTNIDDIEWWCYPPKED